MPSLRLFPKSTALVLIDLQKGITSFQVEPHPTEVVLENASLLANEFRGLNAPVFLIRAAFPSGPLALNLVTDAKAPLPANEPEGWSEPAVKPQENDVLILKRQWGAFYGTELDLQLRRRHVDTIVIGGIATNFGVESTARSAYELGYQLLLVEDAMASFSKTQHDFATQNIFPRLGRVRTTVEIVRALRDSD
ncbi:MAG TPA: hydrolase [Chthoniobacterales bacterium]|nr:hydrolase [Chthoniobacterales bacterium]